MSKRVRKNNYTSYNPYHMYSFGGGFKEGLGNLSFDGTGLGQAVGQNIGAIGSAVGGAVGGLLSNGLESKAGSVFNTIGDIGSAIPGPWGAIIGGGAKIVGGAVNAMFGSKVDQEKLNAANQGTSYLNNFTSNASSFDEIQGPQAQAAVENAYKGGLFSKKKARRKNAELRRQRQEAQLFANRNVENNVENIADEQMNNMLANYAAFGGPLDIGIFPVGGAIDYELAQRRLGQRDLEIQGKSKFAVGGPLHTHGTDWTNGITIIDNGGSHESNPFEGVPMGIADDGKPNLVEEGEVIFNDYVYSNRLRVPKAVRNKYKLRGTKPMTFADAAKQAQKESEERPNDPISQRGLEDIMQKLMVEQETLREQRQSRKYAEGGGIHIKPSKRGTFTAAASKHDMGVQEFASKVLANPDNYSPAMRKKAQFAKNASKWKHAYGGLMGHHFAGTEDDPEPNSLVFLNGGQPIPWLNTAQEQPVVTPPLSADERFRAYTRKQGIETTGLPNPMRQSYKDLVISYNPTNGGTLGSQEKGTTTYDNGGNSWLTGLRFVPAIGAGIGVFSDLMGWTNKPDYSNADSILNAAGSIGDVHYTPIGDYMRYTPLDRLFYANQLGAQAGATRRNIMNTSGGNRGVAMAGLLSADYNAQGQLGNLFRQAEEYNLGQRERVATFNRATNMFNAENELKAQIANRENAKIRVDAAAKAAAIRDQVDARVGAAKSANLTNLFNSLGDIGREAFTMNMVMSNPALYYSIGRDGTITYKNGFDELSEGEKAQVRRAAERARRKKACGGYLTTRRRR
ncbi:MAG: hypothetical protein IJV29_18890 [Butyrivibrio sp.]|nr:hypothetical protein [Butyrivibrio sp.]MBQ7431680.1 hypothetical protein [Butyrivibrio sp.]